MSALADAIYKLQWGANQLDWSSSLTPAECQAVLDKIESLTPAPPLLEATSEEDLHD